MGHVEADPLPEGTGDGVGGVDPAVRVQHVLHRHDDQVGPGPTSQDAKPRVKPGPLRPEIWAQR
jgi:hypothetical protein